MKKPKAKGKPLPVPASPLVNENVTYRDLRNTPGRVWERLAQRETLTLVAEGEAKAILIPIVGGDVAGTYEALARGRSLLAAARLRRQGRKAGADLLTLDDVNALIKSTREERRKADRHG